jgi:F0F1-type ATP synthase assembly protein I
MTLTEIVKTVTELISELNKSESNTQQKQFLATLRRLERQIKKQDTTAKRHLVIGIVVSAVVSWLLGHFFR